MAESTTPGSGRDLPPGPDRDNLPSCAACGSPLVWITCWYCRGNGEDPVTMFEDDEPDQCPECSGDGGWHGCNCDDWDADGGIDEESGDGTGDFDDCEEEEWEDYYP